MAALATRLDAERVQRAEMFQLIMSELGALALAALLLGAIGAPMMKYFVNSLSLAKLMGICAWACFRVFVGCLALLDATASSSDGRLPPQTIGLLGLLTLIGVGWLISHDLEPYVANQSGPGIGAKVIAGWVLLSWIVVGASMAASRIAML
jgi:hypothetical protein